MVKIPFACLPDGRVGFPGTAVRNNNWRCPGCHKRVVLKRGAVIQAHFAHHVASGCGGGESIQHRATKEWIAANVSNPDFRITSRCSTCREPFTVFRGAAGLAGHTEVPVLARKYVVDAAAVGPAGRVALNIEVVHTHRSSPEKMNVIGAEARDGAVEVAAADLVKEGYPLEFCDVRIGCSRCRPCLRRAVQQRRTAAAYRRQLGARKTLRAWQAAVAAAKSRRARRFGKRWLLLHRAPRASVWAARAAQELHNTMFKPCAKCGADVQIKEWKHTKGAKCNAHELVYGDINWEVNNNGQYYHKKCLPNCSECGETKKPEKWCQCQKRAHRKCVDCGKWHKKELMRSNVLPRDRTEWVCDACSTECYRCNARISAKQSQYGGKCYRCNRSAKIVAAGGDPTDGYCTECGKRLTSSQFEKCYACYKGNYRLSLN